MTALRRLTVIARATRRAAGRSASVFLQDLGRGLLEVSHNTLALVGFVLVALILFAASRADLRHEAELLAFSWLQARQPPEESRPPPSVQVIQATEPERIEPDAVARATASDPKSLNRPQAAVTQWLSRRYRVAPEPISRLVLEAWHVGDRVGLDPTLILAIMAVESSFNPFAQSSVGAQGLMQVMTKVHDDKYEAFGGNRAAFDPVTNLRVGVQVLKECIARSGSLEAGLRAYVGGNVNEDSGYAGKVLNEQSSLRQVAGGKSVPARTPVAPPAAPLQAVADAPKAEPERGQAEPAPAKTEDAKASDDQIALLR